MMHLLPYHGNDRLLCVNNYWSCILGYHGIAQKYDFITELLAPVIGKVSKYFRKDTDSKLVDIT